MAIVSGEENGKVGSRHRFAVVIRCLLRSLR
jgi:hypothetical protein